MSAPFINQIVGRFDAMQYPSQAIEAAIPAPSIKLSRIRVQLRTLPCDIKANLFARDTMASWFRMTGVGTPIARIEDKYKLDQIKAIESSCKHKLREYQIAIPPGMTARAALMDHIFKVALRNSTPAEKMAIIQAMNCCSSVTLRESLTSRFCAMAIKALKVAKWVAESRVFQLIAALSFIIFAWYSCNVFYSIFIKGRIFSSADQELLYLLIGYIGLRIILRLAVEVILVCVEAIENLSRFAHKRAEIAYENDQLRRAYITWMNETAVC